VHFENTEKNDRTLNGRKQKRQAKAWRFYV